MTHRHYPASAIRALATINARGIWQKEAGEVFLWYLFSPYSDLRVFRNACLTHDGAVDEKTVLFGEGGFLQLSSGNDSIHSPELETSDVVMSSHGDV